MGDTAQHVRSVRNLNTTSGTDDEILVVNHWRVTQWNEFLTAIPRLLSSGVPFENRRPSSFNDNFEDNEV